MANSLKGWICDMAKKYADAVTYEGKLKRVMERLEVESFDYNWDRRSCWVEFWYEGQLYRFEHSFEKSRNGVQSLQYGSDAFAQVVLTLEDIARMTERGIYKLSVWVSGLKVLPSTKDVPECIKLLGFNDIPTVEDLKARFRLISKSAHPDVGGDEDYFISVRNAYQESLKLLSEEGD